MMDDQLKDVSVQDVIDRLMEIENKSQSFNVCVIGTDGFDLDVDAVEIIELVTSDKEDAGVDLSIVLDESVDDSLEEDEDRVIDYCGENVTLSHYEDKHRPQNQKKVRGIPFNPVLRVDFDQTPNDDREALETSDWWDLPYIRSCTWANMGDSYTAYLERVSVLKDFTPKSQTDFDLEQEEIRIRWFKSWPGGVRYEIRCLDGGAWDRSTNRGFTASLDDALKMLGK
ncbi:MAG: hypothetical protein QM500_12495 [Methylococcales bacterium]